MAFPPIHELRATFNKLPMLDEGDLDRALKSAGESLPALPPDKRTAFLVALNTQFDTYFKERLWQLWAAKAPASKTAVEMKRLASAADKLATLLELVEPGPGALNKQRGRLNELYRMVLVAQGGLYAEEIGGFPDLAPFEFTATTGEQKIVRKDYRADEKLGQFLDALQLWRKLLHRAHAYEREKMSKPTDRARREPNKAMHTLFCMLGSVWTDAFENLPSDGWNPYKDVADGPYFRFLGSLFKAIKGRIGPDLTKDYPQLARDMAMTPNAIRARFRATAEARMPALVKRMERAQTAAPSGETKRKK